MAPPTPTPAPNGTNATPEHRPPPALPPDPSEADIHFQDRWFPAVGHVRQPPDHGVIPGPGAITARTRDGRRGRDAGEHGVVGFDQLPGDGQSKTIEPTKRIKTRRSNVRHKGPFGFG